MFQRSSLSVLAVLAVGGALITGCSSSPSSSSAPAATTSAPAASTSATASSPAASGGAAAVSAADCKIITPISAGVISTLLPLESEPTSKATAGIKAYIAKLTADEAKLTSAGGKAALGSFITALQKSLTEPQAQATTAVTAAVGNLGTVCAS